MSLQAKNMHTARPATSAVLWPSTVEQFTTQHTNSVSPLQQNSMLSAALASFVRLNKEWSNVVLQTILVFHFELLNPNR